MVSVSQGENQRPAHGVGQVWRGEVVMARIAPVRRDGSKDLETVFQITEAVMGFVPNSMLIMARNPELLAAFAELSAVIVARPGRIDPGLKAPILYVGSRAGCVPYF